MRISVISPSDIAYRRFMPALVKAKCFEFAGVGYHSCDEIINDNYSDLDLRVKSSRIKAQSFIDNYGGQLYDSYNSVVYDNSVDCIYIPLPPALHYEYAIKALENGKHIIIEKPATLHYEDMKKLVHIANKRNLAIHENYMFEYHSQLDRICRLIKEGVVGDVRLFRIAYGFPFRGENDFRYKKEIGGGALLDAGGYTIKLASLLLGNTSMVDSANINYIERFSADIYGQGTIINNNGLAAQISFGMDNDYKCELEVWGSQGTLFTNRIFTSPSDYFPTLYIRKNGIENKVILEKDDSFYNSIMLFYNCISDANVRNDHLNELLLQAKLFEEFKLKAGIVW